MKIENIKLIDKSLENYSLLKIHDKVYDGFLGIESAKVYSDDFCVFSISNLRKNKDGIFGDFELINSEYSEILSVIGELDILPLIYENFDIDENKLISTEIYNFYINTI